MLRGGRPWASLPAPLNPSGCGIRASPRHHRCRSPPPARATALPVSRSARRRTSLPLGHPSRPNIVSGERLPAGDSTSSENARRLGILPRPKRSPWCPTPSLREPASIPHRALSCAPHPFSPPGAVFDAFFVSQGKTAMTGIVARITFGCEHARPFGQRRDPAVSGRVGAVEMDPDSPWRSGVTGSMRVNPTWARTSRSFRTRTTCANLSGRPSLGLEVRA